MSYTPELLEAMIPSEETEQYRFANWLTHNRILYVHVPNEGKRTPSIGRKLKRIGLQPGFPDILIFDPPPFHLHSPGVAIEMKRQSKKATATKRQVMWLDELSKRGWYTRVCHGAAEAIDFLYSLGYGRG